MKEYSYPKPFLLGNKLHYQRVMIFLVGLAALFLQFEGPLSGYSITEFLFPRYIFTLIAISLVIFSFFSEDLCERFDDITAVFLGLLSIHMTVFIAINEFGQHVEYILIPVIFFTNLHLFKVQYLVVYNVIIFGLMEYILISDPVTDSGVFPYLSFLTLIVGMFIGIAYQIHRIRLNNRMNEINALSNDILDSYDQPWILFDASGHGAVRWNSPAERLFLGDYNSSGHFTLQQLVAHQQNGRSILESITSDREFHLFASLNMKNRETGEFDISGKRIGKQGQFIILFFHSDIIPTVKRSGNEQGLALQYRNYLESSKEALVVTTEEGAVKLMNRTAHNLFGTGPKENPNEKLYNIVEEALILSLIREVISIPTGTMTSRLLTSAHAELKAGTLITVRKTESVLDKGYELIWNFIDPAESYGDHAAEYKLISGLMKSKGILTMVTGKNNRILRVNEVAESVTGYSAEDLTSMKITAIIHPDDISKMDTADKDGKGTEIRLLTSSEGIAWVYMIRTGTKEEELFLADDITEYKRVQSLLDDAQSNIHALIENTGSPVVSIDFNHNITVMNMNFSEDIYKEFGRRPVTGSRLWDFIPRKDKSEWKEAIDRGMNGERSEVKEVKTKNTGRTYIETSFYPVKNQKGITTGVTIMSRDVTDRELYLQNLAEQKMKAEKATAAKSTFLSTMTHEIRTPLNGLIGMTDLLRGTKLSKEQEQYLNTIKLSGDALLSLINDILDFSKIESDKLELHSVPFSIGDCIDETIEMLRYRGSERGNEINKVIAGNIPEVITGDKIRLRQVLINLVGNAIKFTENGTITISANQLSDSDDHVLIRFSVSDTGIGIPEDKLDKIFSEFTQADPSVSADFGGTGLGLSISSRLVKLMGGEISVESQVGKGTTFHFTIKAEHGSISSEAQGKEGSSLHVSDHSDFSKIHPARILVADDNEVNQSIIKVQLEKLGYNPVIVKNGLEVLEKVEAQEFDLIFMDVKMPDMDGLEASRRITREHIRSERPCIIAMTGFAMEEDKEKCFKAGMDDYILKPVKIDDIMNAIMRWIERPDERSSMVDELLDHNAIDRIMTMAEDDPKFVQNLLQMFIEQSSEMVDKMINEAKGGEIKKLWETAHKLKGSSLNIGAKAVADACLAIEKLESSDKEALLAAVEQLRGTFNETVPLLRGSYNVPGL